MRTAPRLRVVAVLGSVALVIASCTAEQSVAPTEAPPSPPPVSDLPATDWTRVDAADVELGGELRLAISSWPQTFNVFQLAGDAAETRQLVAPTGGGPLVIDASGSAVLDEDYATSVEQTSDDPQVVEIHLNQRAVWEDGTPITVADYVATWRALNGSDDAYRSAATAGYETVASVEPGDDEYHVVITFSEPFAEWRGLLTGVIKESIASDPAVFNEGFRALGMPSSGPFVFTEIDEGGGSITLERNPLWWGEAAKLDRIAFQTGNPHERRSWFADGALDALDISSEAELYASAQAADDAEIQVARALAWSEVVMNIESGPLADERVRRAVASVVDRERIAVAENAPVGFPAVTQDDQIFLPGQAGYSDAALTHDSDAGAAFLEDAGYAAEDGSWVRAGERLELSITVPDGAEDKTRLAEEVRADLDAFGIPVDIVSVPRAEYANLEAQPDAYQMVLVTRAGSVFPIAAAEQALPPPIGAQRLAGTGGEALTDLWDRANVEPDPAERLDIAREINAVVWGYVPTLPLAPDPNVYAVRDGLVNYGATQFETVDWTIVGWAAE